MKNKIPFLLIVAACYISACNKPSPSAGSWAFQGVTYTAVAAAESPAHNLLTALDVNNEGSAFFYFNTYPAASTTLTIVNSMTPAAGQVGVQFGEQQQSYGNLYVPTAGTAQIAKVTVSGGRVSISVPAITLFNQNNPVDSGTFTASITQTQ